MNPYTSTWTGVTPGDGPQEVHVVLLDNGRTHALADEVGRQALRCIRCSACLNVCPVYERTGGHAYGSVYPGPIGAILTPLLRGVGDDEQTDSLPYASRCAAPASRSARCASTSPRCWCDLRAQVVDAHRGGRAERRRLAMRAAPWTFSRPRRLGAAEQVAGIGRGAGRVGGVRRCPAARPRWPPARAGSAGRRPRPAGARASRSAPGGGGTAAEGGRVVSAREEILGRARRALAASPPAGPDVRPRPGRPDRRTTWSTSSPSGSRTTAPSSSAAAATGAAASAAGCAPTPRRVLVPAGVPARVARRRSSTTA